MFLFCFIEYLLKGHLQSWDDVMMRVSSLSQTSYQVPGVWVFFVCVRKPEIPEETHEAETTKRQEPELRIEVNNNSNVCLI